MTWEQIFSCENNKVHLILHIKHQKIGWDPWDVIWKFYLMSSLHYAKVCTFIGAFPFDFLEIFSSSSDDRKIVSSSIKSA